MDKSIVNPQALAKPVGYSHAIAVKGGTTVYLAGQTGTDAAGKIVVPGDIVGQFGQAVANLEIAVEACGGALSDIVKLTLFVTDVAAYKANLKPIGETYRAHFGAYYPPTTLVEVKALFDPQAMIEIEGIAVVE